MRVGQEARIKVKIITAIGRLKGPLVGATIGFICVVLITASTSDARDLQQRPAVTTDEMVATVNGEMISYSDLVWQLTLQPGMSIDPVRTDDLKRALSLLIDQQLILQEARKLPSLHAEDKEVDEALAELARHFSGQAELSRRMIRVGLTSERLREIMHERVDIEQYLDFRFRSFVVITEKEIETYYRLTYVRRFRERTPGTIVPRLQEARAEIEKILTEEKIAISMQGFLEEARQRATIVILREFK